MGRLVGAGLGGLGGSPFDLNLVVHKKRVGEPE